jgi:hypothetical protein
MTPQSKTGEAFFYRYHLIISAIVFLGFGSNILLRTEKVIDVSIALVLHGLFMFAWYALIVIQTRLISKGNHKLHMALGQASMAVVLGIIISGITITVISYQSRQEIGIVGVNLIIVINLMLLYGMGLANRGKGAYHKRYMTFASLAMMLPALARVTSVLDVNDFISLPFLIVLSIIPLVYDYRTSKTIHKATWIGFMLVLIGTIISIVLVSTPAFTTLVDKLLM